MAAATDWTQGQFTGAGQPAPAHRAALGPQTGAFHALAGDRPSAMTPAVPALLRPRAVQRSTRNEGPEPGLSWTPGVGIRPVGAGSSPGSPGSPGTPLQRSVTVDEVVAEVTPASSDASRGAGQDAGQDAAAGPSPEVLSDQQLDMLARRIYGRIRDRLGSELLLDRERAGSLADL